MGYNQGDTDENETNTLATRFDQDVTTSYPGTAARVLRQKKRLPCGRGSPCGSVSGATSASSAAPQKTMEELAQRLHVQAARARLRADHAQELNLPDLHAADQWWKTQWQQEDTHRQ